MPAFGLNILFPYGLAIGTCAAVINMNIISATIRQAVDRGKKGPVIVGFVVRILLYAGAFVLAANTGILAFLGAAIGALLPHLMIYIRHALIPKFRKGKEKEPAPVYVVDTRSLVFFKEPWFVKYKSGRAYLTHRHFRRIRVDKTENSA